MPFAVVVTTNDEAVPVSRQRDLAEACRAQVFEVPIRHLEIVTRADRYNPVLLEALSAVRSRVAAAA